MSDSDTKAETPYDNRHIIDRVLTDFPDRVESVCLENRFPSGMVMVRTVRLFPTKNGAVE